MRKFHKIDMKKSKEVFNQLVIFNETTQQYVPLNLPENFTNYMPIINNKDGGLTGELSSDQKQKKVLVIGAGSAGICAAYELLKKGLEPVIYEPQEWIGGRIYTHDMSETDTKYVELGAMRIPQTQQSIFNYLYNLGVMKRQFPDSPDPETKDFSSKLIEQWPLFPSPAVVNTKIQFQNRTVFYKVDANGGGQYSGDETLIRHIETITKKFNDLIDTNLYLIRKIDNAFWEQSTLNTVTLNLVEKVGDKVEKVGDEIESNLPNKLKKIFEKKLSKAKNKISKAESKLSEKESNLLDDYNKIRLEAWLVLVNKFEKFSLFDVLANQEGWTPEELTLLGTVGIGTGGVGSLYNTVYLETLRESYHMDDTNQRLIQGGLRQLTDAFATDIPKNTAKSLAQVNNWTVDTTSVFPKVVSHDRKRVTKIRTSTDTTSPNYPIKVWHDRWDDNQKKWIAQTDGEIYDSVILTASLRAIEMYIDINDKAFSAEVWQGIREFGMVDSNKIFFYCKTKWWKKWNEQHKDHNDQQIVTTLTDLTLSQTYFMDEFGTEPLYQGEGGVVLLNYCWNKDASKFGALTIDEKINLCMREFQAVFPEGAFEEFKRSLPEGWESGAGVKCINWNNTPHMNGAFRMADPGQYCQHDNLYEQGNGEGASPNNGLYLAGESLAWFGLSGWIEGALYTGIDAAQSVMNKLTNE